jgi:hypothetical protein
MIGQQRLAMKQRSRDGWSRARRALFGVPPQRLALMSSIPAEWMID